MPSFICTDYAFNIQDYLIQAYRDDPKNLKSSIDWLRAVVPPPISNSYERIPKEDSIREYEDIHARVRGQRN